LRSALFTWQSVVAASLGVAAFHLEEMKENKLLRCGGLEDDKLHAALASLHQTLHSLPIDGVPSLTMAKLASHPPAVRAVEGVAEEFKLAKNVDVVNPIPVDLVLARALQADAPALLAKTQAEDTEIYGEQQELNYWADLELQLRVRHSNAHHAMWRATVAMRKLLVRERF